MKSGSATSAGTLGRQSIALPIRPTALPITSAGPPVNASVANAGSGPVYLTIGPGGDLFYVGFLDGTVHRVQFFGSNQPPTAVIQADATSGAAPLTVHFNGAGSTDPDAGTTLSYSWDLNGD